MEAEITNCRNCTSKNLEVVLSLGEQFLTGIFPKSINEKIIKGNVDLVFCKNCTLVQLKQTFDLEKMYGENYGYRSGLNPSMVVHLTVKIRTLEQFVKLTDNDLVIDVGSNDATLLKAYTGKHRKIGVDPTGKKFKDYYPADIILIPEFFTFEALQRLFPNEKAKIITSISMFYDLPHPKEFVQDIAECLAEDGIWHFEQSYLPSMLQTNSYDTICHEHLEFYSLKVVKELLENNNLRIIEVELNDINGGSFAVTACKKEALYKSNNEIINSLLIQEQVLGLHTVVPYQDFALRMEKHRQELLLLLNNLVSQGKKIIGYGASTKGNVLLQYCKITPNLISHIAEINEDKFDSFTPGTLIPIISEKEAQEMKPDYFFVLPWHFKNTILESKKDYMKNGGKFIFPLPEIEIV